MIINLTQHPATPEQRAEGVFDLSGEMLDYLKTLLNFEGLPTVGEVYDRAGKLADITGEFECRKALIGGAPFLMAPLANSLNEKGIEPLCAFSKRDSVEETLSDGTVKKVSVFRHAGFVPAV